MESQVIEIAVDGLLYQVVIAHLDSLETTVHGGGLFFAVGRRSTPLVGHFFSADGWTSPGYFNEKMEISSYDTRVIGYLLLLAAKELPTIGIVRQSVGFMDRQDQEFFEALYKRNGIAFLEKMHSMCQAA
jgi:hypothetical protein